jgi:molybdenum cofactor cytidylyltransferase
MATDIAAVVLAAGLSRRMGQPKLSLPWGAGTVIGRVVEVLSEAGAEPIVVVTGAARQDVESALAGFPARTVYNARYQQDNMAFSLAAGLAALPTHVTAALVALGDQPQIESSVVSLLLQAYQATRKPLIVPSYQMRRGHPWIVDRALWGEIISLKPPNTLRDFLQAHSKIIQYVNITSESIFSDLDTPQDYQREHPHSTGT